MPLTRTTTSPNHAIHAIASTLAVVLSLTAGCGTGADRPPPSQDRVSAPDAGDDAAPEAGVGATRPPGCGTQSDGSYCECIDVPLYADPPNIYFVLDRSGSMGGAWLQLRNVVTTIVQSLGARASFGATIFPSGDSSATCDVGHEILAIRPGDPIGAKAGPTTTALADALKKEVPAGGTPTSATLQQVLPILTAAKGKTFVILVTDGAPNCNVLARCGVDECQLNIDNTPDCPPEGPSCCGPPGSGHPNCNDTAATTSAVAALKRAGIPVFVAGLPGSAPYGSVLDQLAVAGGTALLTSPNYYRVDSTATSAQLLATLKKVAAKIVGTCELGLKETPEAEQLVNVYLDDLVLAKDATNGWKIEGPKVTLLGSACQRMLDGDIFDVRVIVGCPTVEPR